MQLNATETYESDHHNNEYITIGGATQNFREFARNNMNIYFKS